MEVRPAVCAAAIIALAIGTADVVHHLVFEGETKPTVSAVQPDSAAAAPKKRRAINIAEPGLCPYKWSLSDDFDVSDDPFVLIPDLEKRLKKYQKQLAALKAITPDESAELRLSAQDAACEYKRIKGTVDDIVTLINIAGHQIEMDEAKKREKKPDGGQPERQNRDSAPIFRDDDKVPM